MPNFVKFTNLSVSNQHYSIKNPVFLAEWAKIRVFASKTFVFTRRTFCVFLIFYALQTKFVFIEIC